MSSSRSSREWARPASRRPGAVPAARGAGQLHASTPGSSPSGSSRRLTRPRGRTAAPPSGRPLTQARRRHHERDRAATTRPPRPTGSSRLSWPRWRARASAASSSTRHPAPGRRTLVVRAAAELGCRRRELHHRRPDQQPGRRPRRAAGRPGPGLRSGGYRPRDYTAPAPARHCPNVTVRTRLDDLGAAQVMLATAAKWATVKDRSWRWAIIDEAYQMRSDMLLAHRRPVRPGVVRR